ncbi:MAG: flagellar FliL protein [Gammaproteobacteria bacterium]|jgi:flagellar FliL protein
MQKIILCAMLMLFWTNPGWAAEHGEVEEAPKLSSAYVSLGKAMVLNLSSSRNRTTFLQIKADILLTNSDGEEIIETHIPAIRHSLIVLLSEQKDIDIKTPAKREEIRMQATAQVKELIAKLSGNEDIADVLFSSILVQ